MEEEPLHNNYIVDVGKVSIVVNSAAVDVAVAVDDSHAEQIDDSDYIVNMIDFQDIAAVGMLHLVDATCHYE